MKRHVKIINSRFTDTLESLLEEFLNKKGEDGMKPCVLFISYCDGSILVVYE